MTTRGKPAAVLPRDARLKSGLESLDFDLPPELEASEPPEARGLARDGVRLMVSHRASDQIIHARFTDLPEFLKAGDALVVNTSGTLNAALVVTLASDGTPYELHLSTRLPNDQWIVEVRLPNGDTTKPFYDAQMGWELRLPGGASASLIAPASLHDGLPHLWTADLNLPAPHVAYLAAHGFPIRYSYIKQSWPGSAYQTVYATEMGSAEMPSAGRAFSDTLLAKLAGMGVQIAPLILHTGVASLDEDELPHEEFFRVPAATAEIVNAARAEGRRVIAVGTTVVRALETVIGPDGVAQPGEGWTRLVVTPQTGIHTVDGLLTGLHEPKSTHVAILEALVPRERLIAAYGEALEQRYLWHEFGDLHLLLP